MDANNVDVQALLSHIHDLEQQLQEARTTIHALEGKSSQGGQIHLPENKPSSDMEHARLTAVLENLPVGVWISDERGRLIHKNKQADLIWAGNSPLVSGIEEYPIYEAWYPGSQTPVQSDEYPMARCIRTGQIVEPVEMRIRRFDGTEGIILVSAVPIRDNQGQLIGSVGVNMDITERKREEERYTLLFNVVQEGFAHYKAIYNTFGKIVDLLVVEINLAGASISGVAREAQIGRTWKVIRPKVDKHVFNLYQRADETDETVRFDDHNHANGRVYEVTINKIMQGEFIVTYNDITERRQAEEALKDSEQRYRGLFEAMQEGLIAAEVIVDEDWNPVDYRYLDVNPAGERLFNIPREEFIGHTYTEVLKEGDQEWITILGKVALTGEPVQVERFGKASQKWFEAHIYSPRAGQFVNILTDITERKITDAALRESEQKFSIMFDKAPFAAALSKLPNGILINVNEEFERAFGFTKKEVTGKTSLELGIHTDAENRARIAADLQAVGTVRNIECTLYKKSGEARIFLLNVDLVNIGDEKYALQTAQDITERKKAEKSLESGEARMRAVFRSLVEGVVFLNSHGEVEEINEAVQSAGHTFEELTDAELDPRMRIIRPDGSFFPEEEQPAIVALRTGQAVRDVEMGVPLRDGRISWRLVNAQPVYNDSGILLGVVASFFDITERKKAEEALRESEQRFHSLADSMPQLVWTALPDGSFDYYNKRHLEFQEIRQVEEDNWEWAPVLHPEDRQVTADAWLHAVKTGEIYQIEHRVRIADGSYRWHLSRGIPIKDEHGRVIRWFGTATDIHDLKAAEEKLRDYAEQLEHSNRDLEQFAFMASHDLQEPLRKIQVFGNLLLERATHLEDREREYVERMHNASTRMRDMVNGLLQLSRVKTQSKPFTDLDLTLVTEGALSDLTDQHLRTEGTVDVAPLPMVQGDPLQLRQLMQNLIGNALKYHQPGVPPRVKVYCREDPDQVQIFVEDNGIGFEMENAEQIFQPFQRLVGRSQYEGSGMGLAICRRIVERHGGEIKAQSLPGQGATFIVTLPKHHPDTSKDMNESKATYFDRGR